MQFIGSARHCTLGQNVSRGRLLFSRGANDLNRPEPSNFQFCPFLDEVDRFIRPRTTEGMRNPRKMRNSAFVVSLVAIAAILLGGRFAERVQKDTTLHTVWTLVAV